MSQRSLGRLTLDLVAKIGGFTQGMSQAERVAQDRTRKIQRTFSTFQKNVAGIFAAIGGAALVRSIIRATAEAEESLALLNNAVEQNGGAAGKTTQQLSDMAGELQRVTTYSDDAIMGAEQLLLRFQSIQAVNFDRALQSTLDLATALGMDLGGAAKLVGKALESPVKGLTQLQRSGVVLEKSQQDLVKRLVETGQIAQAQQALLDGLEGRYKGAATAARDTFGGALQGLSNALGDLLEGKSGLPKATEEVNRLADALSTPRAKKGADTLVSGLAVTLRAAGGFLGELVGETTIIPTLMKESFRDTFRLTTEMERLERQIRDIDRHMSSVSLGVNPWLDSFSTDELRRMREEAELLLEMMSRSSGPTTRGRRRQGPVEPDPTEEFLKLEARLQEQIALYGKVGEAAKIAYQIQSGQLDELSQAEQQRVLGLAQQIDALHALTEAEKEAAAERYRVYEQQYADRAAIQEWFLDQEQQALEEGNKVAADMYEVAFDGVSAELEYAFTKTQDTISEYAIQAARNMQTAFADFLFDPFKEGLDGMLKGFIDTLRRMVAEAAASKIFDTVGASLGGSGGVGGFLGNLLGFANGGSFTVGGNGGTDSQLVAFRATPGEMVNVRTPEAREGGTTINISVSNSTPGVAEQIVAALSAAAPTLVRESVQQSRAAVRDDMSRGYYRG